MNYHFCTRTRRLAPSLSAITVIMAILSFGVLQAFAQSQSFAYRLIEVTENEFIYQVYAFQEERRLDLSDLEVWPDVAGTEPLRVVFWTEPDLKYRLLEKGYARLRDEANSPSQYVKAQEAAKQNGLGMWHVPAPTPTPVPVTADPTSSKSSPLAVVTGLIQMIPWRNIANLVLAGIGIFGGYELLMLIIGWFRRHRVTFIMAGEPATGKSWLWERILTPDITLNELKKIESTTVVTTRNARTL